MRAARIGEWLGCVWDEDRAVVPGIERPPVAISVAIPVATAIALATAIAVAIAIATVTAPARVGVGSSAIQRGCVESPAIARGPTIPVSRIVSERAGVACVVLACVIGGHAAVFGFVGAAVLGARVRVRVGVVGGSIVRAGVISIAAAAAVEGVIPDQKTAALRACQ
jgi:hypothetical protein